MLHPLLEINRSSLGDVRLVEGASEPLGDQEVRLRIDRFAITANNVTYAVFGDVLGYWDFFPTDPPWGRVPAMGWAEITESNNSDVAEGSRYYGWYPMAAETTIRATATADGFRDDGGHRQPHAAVYRAYVDTHRDPLYDLAPDGEDRHALLRGLFLTGFLAEEFFADPGSGSDPYFRAQQVIVVSASSKTAIGFAQRAKDRGAAAVIGITSEHNAEFVAGLDYYDTVLTYGGLENLESGLDAVSIDMAGNPAVLSDVHQRLGERLKYSMTVGRSHHDAPAPATEPMPGPKPELFFAPTEVSRRREEWGREDFNRRAAHALGQFVEGSRSWLTVEHRLGPEATAAAWRDIYDGAVAPDVGLVATLHA
ncbi:MAG: DUF2855 family protein [Acidimicrobiia bacterium]|nr:DUF2855 family protein [Acidimicrobiia bacterium]